MITTIEELEALPVDSVIKNRHGWVLAKDSDWWWSFGFESYGADVVAQDMLPATLLIPNTISQEKFMEALREFLKPHEIGVGGEFIPAFAVALETLGIEVSDG